MGHTPLATVTAQVKTGYAPVRYALRPKQQFLYLRQTVHCEVRAGAKDIVLIIEKMCLRAEAKERVEHKPMIYHITTRWQHALVEINV
jgi:hypothetical protein